MSSRFSGRATLLVLSGLLAFCVQGMAAEQAANRGATGGIGEQVGSPPTLRIYEEAGQRQQAKTMLAAFVAKSLAPVAERRQQELAAFTSPDQWRQRQQRVRQRLGEFLGDFGPKCPLGAHIIIIFGVDGDDI